MGLFVPDPQPYDVKAKFFVASYLLNQCVYPEKTTRTGEVDAHKKKNAKYTQ
jgi:hypothetical protein